MEIEQAPENCPKCGLKLIKEQVDGYSVHDENGKQTMAVYDVYCPKSAGIGRFSNHYRSLGYFVGKI